MAKFRQIWSPWLQRSTVLPTNHCSLWKDATNVGAIDDDDDDRSTLAFIEGESGTSCLPAVPFAVELICAASVQRYKALTVLK